MSQHDGLILQQIQEMNGRLGRIEGILEGIPARLAKVEESTVLSRGKALAYGAVIVGLSGAVGAAGPILSLLQSAK